MSCAIPYWIQVFQALLTPAVAVLAGVIAFFQWRTAHQKMVIDLFDRRMKIYADCRDVLQPIITSPAATRTQNGLDFIRASADAKFLFGEEVIEKLEKVEQAIFDYATYEAELNGTPIGLERSELVTKSRAALETIKGFYKKDFRSLLMPYMQLKQTLWL